MKAVPKRWLSSMFSGLALSGNFFIDLIRILTFSVLILAFLIPSFIKMETGICSMFAVILAAIVFIVKAVLVTMNVIVNHSQTVPVNSGQEELENTSHIDVNSDIAPENIPQELWDKRDQLPKDQPITENVFNSLIQQGFDPNDVVNMVKIIAHANINGDEEETESSMYNNVFTIFGHDFLVPFNRVTVDAVFTGNYSYTYAFVGFVACFCMTFIALLVMNEMDFWTNFWLSFIFGPAIYSILSPPEVDAYSTTKGDICTGLTRPITIAIFALVLLGALWSDEEPEFYKDLELPVDYKSITESIYTFCRAGLLLFPIWSVLFVGQLITVINWLFDWIGQYLLGHSGSTGALNSMVLLIRSSVPVYFTYELLKNDYSITSLASGVGMTTLILHIPLSFRISCNCQRVFWSIVSSLLISLTAFASCYLGGKYAYISSEEMYIFAVASVFILDCVYPYISSYSSYIIFSMRFNTNRAKTPAVLRMLTPTVMIPLIIGVVLTKKHLSPVISAFFIIMFLNKSYTEPHIVGIALLLHNVFFMYEIEFTNEPVGLMYSLWLARKLFSIYTISDYFFRSRLSLISRYVDQFIDEDTVLFRILRSAIFMSGILMPGPDRSISTTSYVWSLVTGAPMNSVPHVPLVLIPSPPRPNLFWDHSYQVNSYDQARNYIQHRNEHIIETPIYVSFSHALKENLASFIRTGKLGIISANTYLLFLSEPLAAFVHIISLETNTINFQVRGLEYNDRTLCHLGEIARLNDDIDSYNGCMPNFKSKNDYISTDWRMCAKGIKLPQYNIAAFEAEQVFIGLDKERAIKWTYISLAYEIKKMGQNSYEGINEQEGELEEKFTTALSIFDVEYDESQKKKLKQLSSKYINLLYDEDMCLDLDKFINIFHGTSEKIFESSSRNLLLWLSLLSMRLGPENDTKEEITDFIERSENTFIVVPAQSTEFNEEYIKEEKNIVSFEEIHDQKEILFFNRAIVNWNVVYVQKEFVRSFWSSEAFEQIFCGEDDPERLSIQEDNQTMRNLIIQTCNIPIGCPSYVSPILASYSLQFEIVDLID